MHHSLLFFHIHLRRRARFIPAVVIGRISGVWGTLSPAFWEIQLPNIISLYMSHTLLKPPWKCTPPSSKGQCLAPVLAVQRREKVKVVIILERIRRILKHCLCIAASSGLHEPVEGEGGICSILRAGISACVSWGEAGAKRGWVCYVLTKIALNCTCHEDDMLSLEARKVRCCMYRPSPIKLIIFKAIKWFIQSDSYIIMLLSEFLEWLLFPTQAFLFRPPALLFCILKNWQQGRRNRREFFWCEGLRNAERYKFEGENSCQKETELSHWLPWGLLTGRGYRATSSGWQVEERVAELYHQDGRWRKEAACGWRAERKAS